MPYFYHFESYNSLIKYADTHPVQTPRCKLLSKVMQEAEAKMINFVTHIGIVPSAMRMGETNKKNNTEAKKEYSCDGEK
jgi:hypothetical protein